jgi:multidrug efflux pump subunit AcrA (membrane-fusion protein)
MNDPALRSSAARQRLTPGRAALAALAFIGIVTMWWMSRSAPAVAGSDPAATAAPAMTAPAAAGTLTPAAQRAAGIEVVTAETATTRAQLQAPAVLQLDETRTARIGAIVEGVIVTLSAQVGDRVARGSVLGTMHSHLVHEALAGYKKAQADQRRQQIELDYAIGAEGRAERLFADKAVSQQEVQRARADRAAATEAVSIAVSERQRAADELEHLGLDPEDSDAAHPAEQIPIRAPIGGILLERLVSAGSAVTPGTPLFVVSDVSQLWAVAEVDQTDLSRLGTGRPASLTVAAYPHDRFAGRILAIGDSIHESTRRVSVRVAVPNHDRRLKPEMYATVDLGLGEPRPVVVVPVAALQTIGADTVVFVQDRDDHFERRTVVVDGEHDGRAELRDGLRPGERVVTTGSFLLKSSLTAPSSPE